MKCQSCGADNTVSAKHCEYCGLSLVPASSVPQKAARIDAAPSAGRADSGSDSFWPKLKDPIFHLWQLPGAHPIRWIAFLFPIAYLAGYGGERAALGLSGMFVVACVAAELMNLVHFKAAQLLLSIFILVYSYKVAIHVDNLASRRAEFDWIKGVGFQLIYLVVLALVI